MASAVHAVGTAADWIEGHPTCIKLLLLGWTLALVTCGWSPQSDLLKVLRGV